MISNGFDVANLLFKKNPSNHYEKQKNKMINFMFNENFREPFLTWVHKKNSEKSLVFTFHATREQVHR